MLPHPGQPKPITHVTIPALPPKQTPPNPLGRLTYWLSTNVAFISWHKHWKGIYLHCLHPRYCIRLYLWGYDRHLKSSQGLSNPGQVSRTT